MKLVRLMDLDSPFKVKIVSRREGDALLHVMWAGGHLSGQRS